MASLLVLVPSGMIRSTCCAFVMISLLESHLPCVLPLYALSALSNIGAAHPRIINLQPHYT
jgi:hypothetical protein